MSETTTPITARALAARVLVRVVRDEAFAAAALEAELGRAVQLDERDRSLATELVYGALRVLPWLVSQMDAHAKKPTRGLPWDVQGALWVAAQQLFFMRVPAFAAVDEAVTAVRRSAGPRVAGFANAVLRKLANSKPAQEDASALRVEALVKSCPDELRAALERALGAEGARAFLSKTDPPPTGLRVSHADARDEVMRRIVSARPHAELHRGELSPLCINAHRLGKAQTLPGLAEGELSIQEEGSQVVALSVGARAGERVLDACAGRGNKTAVLSQSGALVDACDRDARKLARLGEEMTRLKTSAAHTFAVDWTVGSGDVQGNYDAILVDAPCSGVGTLRRRPELALRPFRPLAERTAEQRAIVVGAARHLAAGGRLVYAVCSVVPEEAEDVVSAVAEHLEPAPFVSDVANAIANGATSFRLLPHVHDTDGYFVASFRRR